MLLRMTLLSLSVLIETSFDKIDEADDNTLLVAGETASYGGCELLILLSLLWLQAVRQMTKKDTKTNTAFISCNPRIIK